MSILSTVVPSLLCDSTVETTHRILCSCGSLCLSASPFWGCHPRLARCTLHEAPGARLSHRTWSPGTTPRPARSSKMWSWFEHIRNPWQYCADWPLSCHLTWPMVGPCCVATSCNILQYANIILSPVLFQSLLSQRLRWASQIVSQRCLGHGKCNDMQVISTWP